MRNLLAVEVLSSVKETCPLDAVAKKLYFVKERTANPTIYRCDLHDDTTEEVISPKTTQQI